MKVFKNIIDGNKYKKIKIYEGKIEIVIANNKRYSVNEEFDELVITKISDNRLKIFPKYANVISLK
jgi:hypothetical protein